ncbi:MAG: beta-ketoacyl synthase N-terminal-like domain-containing protein, partial [Blastocatellia bacterium]
MSDSEPSGANEIAIIGISIRLPGAKSIKEFWQNLRDGVESISCFSNEELESFMIDPSALSDPSYVKAGCVLEDVEMFDASFFDFSPREAEITDPQHRLFLECAWEALEDAGYDPAQQGDTTGVFAGSGMSTYLLLNLFSNPALFKTASLFQVTVGNDKDYLATRVSYKLNLKGPSLSVQTACSTSLVAVSLACQSLLDYQCDMALAGGVSIRLPQKTGYWYQEGGIASPDGHCRTFDAKAEGTVFGSGLGIVVLKRLEEALSDGDNIYAVIKGSAVNNDGSSKIGFTAPSVDGQANVIAEALTVSGVSAESLTYVEAHGTATPIGDPIEITALQKVFAASTNKRRFCGIGSVKSNLGHMDTAAGIAGLIKTALALKHKLIPPSLHFENPNPQIDFENSAFYVNTKLREWKADGTPRRAGVSSFGIGGTNAHVIVEEAPAVESSEQSRPWQLLTLSARTITALDAATIRLADYLKQNPDVNLADVAYTLKVGRRPFDHRRMLVCRETDEARRELETLDAQTVRTITQERSQPSIVFMFSGQGSQYVEMGLELYQTEPTFRKELDNCSELLKPHLGFDLRDVLYPKDGSTERAAERLQKTQITQPAIFAIEYALAMLWMNWGVRPQAMIGHSIGEYVAACLAGVFSLEDALALVAARGQLMQKLPAGLMLAVQLPESELKRLLGSKLSIASVNGPSLCVVSGAVDAVAGFEKELDYLKVDHRRLHTSHAFHSEMMASIVEPFIESVRRVKLNTPSIPYLSNVTGTWVTTEPTDPVYWGKHLRQTVRFADGLNELLKDRDRVLLEIGPGQTLMTLARQHSDKSVDQPVFTSLSHPQQKQSDVRLMLNTLGKLWLLGAQIDWAGFYKDEDRHRVSLPTYPFERKRYWIDPPKQRPAAQLEQASDEVSVIGSVGDITDSNVSMPQAEPVRSAYSRPLLSNPYVRSRNEIEATIAGIWEELLGIKPVGIHDDFFELGGHSLLATHLVARLHQVLHVDIPLRSLFDTPTVSTLAASILKRKEDRAESGDEPASSLPTIAPDPDSKHQPFPLTDVQQAYWVGRSGGLELGNVATHMYFELESEELDLERFNRAWQRLIDRHDMLRDIVLPDGRQQILEPRIYDIKVLDLRDRTDEEKTREANLVRQRMSHQVLPADRWPLFEITATRFDERRLRLHVSFDFLIGDARSLQILGRDLTIFYNKPDAILPPLELSFRDYVLAQLGLESTQLYQRSLDYWMRRLPTLPPAPDLPLAKNPGSLTHPRFLRRSAVLDREKWLRLKSRAASSGVTPSGVLLAAFAEVLAAWSNNPRFTINLTLFNRLPMHPQVNSIVGDFTSLTLLEVDNTEGDTFEARAKRLQQQLWEDIDHRYVSAVRVMRELTRTQGWKPGAAMPVVFTSILNVGAAGQEISGEEANGLAIEGEVNYSISQTPQVWIDHQVTEVGGALSFNWDAVEDLFPDNLLQDMFSAYVSLLHNLASDDSTWLAPHLHLLPDHQFDLFQAVNSTLAPVSDALLHSLFEAQARLRPHDLAVISAGSLLTYQQLNRRANHLASVLREQGASPNKLIAVVMHKDWHQVVAVLAILKAGAAYLPISAQFPQQRICELLDDGDVEIALTQKQVDHSIDWPPMLKRVVIVDDETGDDENLQPLQ